ATYTCKSFYMTVPWSNIFITDWPIDCKAIPGWSFKVIFAPTLDLTRPQKRFSPNLITPDPIEWLFLLIRVFLVLNKKMLGGFAKSIASGHNRIFLANLKRNLRSEEHTSELQSRENLVCRLLLEKKKKQTRPHPTKLNSSQ